MCLLLYTHTHLNAKTGDNPAFTNPNTLYFGGEAYANLMTVCIIPCARIKRRPPRKNERKPRGTFEEGQAIWVLTKTFVCQVYYTTHSARIKRKNGIKPVFTQKHYDLQNTKENHLRVIISRFILRPLICDNLQVAQSAETLGSHALQASRHAPSGHHIPRPSF